MRLFLKILIPVVVIIAIVVPVAVVFTRSDPDLEPIVNTTVGRIRGLNSEDGTYYMFLGIPYATVDPRNPFGVAIPNPVFEDVFNAFEDQTHCPQIVSNRVTGSLDCLQLNVYVTKTEEKPLPVLVYIHGGGFVTGTSARSHYNPKFLLRHDVIYVSFHYRLSVYGFMCLHTPEVPGNQGLKDQQNALRWIKNNIKAFGGDDENITIFGDSAGGAAVDLQLLFADDGLFHKVLAQSGSSLGPPTVGEPDLEVPTRIARHMDFLTNDMNEAVEFLANQTATRVMEAVMELGMSTNFRPVVEREFPNVESFMTTHPVNTPMTRARQIPLLAGYNDDESVRSYANMADEEFNTLDVFNSSLRRGFTFEHNFETMYNFVRRFYAGDEPMSAKLRRNVIDFNTDFTFAYPAQRSIAKHLKYGGVAYHYVFTYIGGRNMHRVRMNITIGGASHSDELGYLFDLPDFTETPTPDDQLMIDRITTLWTNFAKYGDPTPTTTALLPVRWLPVVADRLNYLNLTRDLGLSARPFHQRLSFWDFFYHSNEEYVRGYTNVSTFSHL